MPKPCSDQLIKLYICKRTASSVGCLRDIVADPSYAPSGGYNKNLLLLCKRTASSVAALARSDCPAAKLSAFVEAAVSKRVCSGVKVCLPEAMAWVRHESRDRISENSRCTGAPPVWLLVHE